MYLIVKRGMDIVIAGTVLLLAAPLIGLVALAIRLALGGPVLFKQFRPGFRDELFACLKFRTMTDARDAEGNLLPDRLRLTKFGVFLRSTSLDELPQLWSILRGDMSLIGPRPLLARYLNYYTPEERRRHSVRPGLTGWAQIHGRNEIPLEERLVLDVWYVDHRSWELDLRILLSTVGYVLGRKGFAADPNARFLDLDQQRASMSLASARAA
jgi:lipopolysaccharide/colanic/teichoic acid biosynthesis glycosyltransferase